MPPMLCKAWKKVALDVAIDTEQPSNTYWTQMTTYFNTNTKGNHQSMDFIRQRWRTINANC
jgi:hypothetical protein